MAINSFTEYNLPKDAYVSFDAVSLKQLMIDLLNQNDIFRDQNYEGSNLNSLIDLIAVAYHILLFYLNTTSSESSFTSATLRENIIKIVSLLNYKPIGPQTSLIDVEFSGTASLPANVYTLKRFASINANGYSYSTINDVSFEKTTAVLEGLATDNTLLYQGSIVEHPAHTATGEDFEVVFVINNDPSSATTRFVADNTFSIFVKNVNTGVWTEFTETDTLHESNGSDNHYEKRLNENGNYEFKFGNGINGTILNEGDTVQIYYILSDGEKGVISNNAFTNSSFVLFNSPTFNDISSYTYNSDETFITSQLLQYLKVANTNNSTAVSTTEDADSMKANAVRLFSTQNRLVTLTDYEAYIEKNYSNIIKSIKCINNNTFTSNYIKYFYDIGLKTPLDDGRVLLNQVDFATSTNFNNIYIFTVPKIQPIIDGKTPNYVSQSIKQLIINETSKKSMSTHNIVCVDPIYKAFQIGLQVPGESETSELATNTRLVIKRDNSSRINSLQIKNRIIATLSSYFDTLKLNSVVDLFVLNSDLLNIEGVKNIVTRRIDTGFETQKINFVVWNPLYPDNDIISTSQNYQLAEYEFAYLYDAANLANNIIIEDE